MEPGEAERGSMKNAARSSSLGMQSSLAVASAETQLATKFLDLVCQPFVGIVRFWVTVQTGGPVL